VNAVACGVLDTIEEDIEAGHNVCADERTIIRRVQTTEVVEKDMPHRFFAFSAKVMTELRSHSSSRNGANYQDQNLKAVNCSSYTNKTTTTNNSEEKISWSAVKAMRR